MITNTEEVFRKMQEDTMLFGQSITHVDRDGTMRVDPRDVSWGSYTSSNGSRPTLLIMDEAGYGKGIREQMNAASRSCTYDSTLTEKRLSEFLKDIEKATPQDKNFMFYTGPAGERAFQEAMENHIREMTLEEFQREYPGMYREEPIVIEFKTCQRV
jgi:hypothetical protein